MVQIKPLEWVDEFGHSQARTNLFASYSVWDASDYWECNLIDGKFKTIEAAKAAAQQDYSARILSALVPAAALKELGKGDGR